MTNFDSFLASPKFASFAEVAVSAEKILYYNKSKSAFKKSLEETQLLLDGLMQKYFG